MRPFFSSKSSPLSLTLATFIWINNQNIFNLIYFCRSLCHEMPEGLYSTEKYSAVKIQISKVQIRTHATSYTDTVFKAMTPQILKKKNQKQEVNFAAGVMSSKRSLVPFFLFVFFPSVFPTNMATRKPLRKGTILHIKSACHNNHSSTHYLSLIY